jgi:4-alpha-glucanotransferase
VRAELDQLAGPVEEEAASAARDRERLLERLAAEGLVSAGSTDEEIIVAMHRFLARTPCRLIAASLYDVLGELAQPNLPGTTDEYPNWRMPLHRSLDQIVDDPRMRRIAAVLADQGLPPAVAGSDQGLPPAVAGSVRATRKEQT